MIKILRNEQGNCINFEGSSNPTYWNACLSGEVDSEDANAVNVVNDVITSETGITEYEFYKIPYTEFVDRDGNSFADAQEAADYITAQANVVGLGGGGTDLTDVSVCFKLDDTSTSVMLDNGYSYGVNTIKATNTGDGLITIQSELGSIIHFTKLDHTNVCNAEGNSISGGLNDVINYLNELFTVGAFESVVISDPYSTMIADVSGVDTNVSYVGYGIDPVGNDVYGSTTTNSQNGMLTTETIDQAGEYFTFDIRVEGTIGFGLVHTQDSYDAGYYNGNSTYADPTTFGISNSGHSGYQFSHWFHPTPNGSWTNYGANTSASYRSGWYNFNGTDEQADWLAGNPIKARVGIDNDGFISIETLRDGVTWEPHARTSYPVPQGSEFRLGIKTNHTAARVFSLPKVHLLRVDDTPTAIGDTNITLLGDALGTLNDGIATASGTNSDNGFITEEGLSELGEYFEFEVNLGSNHTVSLVDADTHSIATIAADTSTDLINPYVYFGQPINNLGAVTLNQHNWSGLPATEGSRFAATHFRIGFDNQGKLTVWSSTDGVNFIVSKHLSSAAVNGDYRLMYIGRDVGATFESLSKGQLTAAPTMYFRHIESPDGVFNYPLFATEEEAKYYHETTAGVSEGVTHTHTYADDPTNTTWYMPDNGQMAGVNAPYNMVFDGQTVLFTEITSLTNADLTPSQFSGSDITQEEGTNVNLQVTPAGASWTTSVVITPSGSGLVYDNYSTIQGTLTDVGADTTYTVTVTRANSYGSSVGSLTITATDVAPVQTNDTPWTKALDFSGGSEYIRQAAGYYTVSPLHMNGYATNIAAPSNSGYTANGSSVRPWATAIVFKIDNVSANQHIWNSGEGAGNGDDNIYLRLDSSKKLYFGWGREGQGYNECTIQATALGHNDWYGVYIANNGTRQSGSNATATALAAMFDIRLMNSGSNNWTIGSNLSIPSAWTSTGADMDKAVTGDLTIGGRGSNRSFQGKVASMVVTTLRINQPMPTSAEIDLMITDPTKWLDDYKVGEAFRTNTSPTDYTGFAIGTESCYRATQVWLMGDGTYDAYPNGIRNQVGVDDQNTTEMQFNSMVSNDIETVNINGLT